MQLNHPVFSDEQLQHYIELMCQLYGLSLSAERQQELLLQFQRIHQFAMPLMDFPLEAKDEIAGVFKS